MEQVPKDIIRVRHSSYLTVANVQRLRSQCSLSTEDVALTLKLLLLPYKCGRKLINSC